MDRLEKAQNILRTTIKEATKLDDSIINEMVKGIPLKAFSKGDILLTQGSAPLDSYFVIKGCVRQYLYDENGKEATIDFFLENDSINMFSYSDTKGLSKYSLSCLEDSVLVVCLHNETENPDDEDPEISKMIQKIFEKQFTQLQHNFANFKMQSPEERFLALKENRADLMNRVPQHLLANYLNITPETYSRFKKRFK